MSKTNNVSKMKSNKKLIDDSIAIEEKKEKMSNAQKSTANLNSTKKIFPSSQKNFKQKTEKESINNEESQQNNNLNVK